MIIYRQGVMYWINRHGRNQLYRGFLNGTGITVLTTAEYYDQNSAASEFNFYIILYYITLLVEGNMDHVIKVI